MSHFSKKFLLFLSLTVIAPIESFADSKEYLQKLKKDCGGLLYRSKKEKVPVYYEDSLSSGVLKKLTLGEKVCVVGKKSGFAIIDRRLLQLKNLELNEESSSANSFDFSEDESKQVLSELAYARDVDLWPPRDMRLESSSSNNSGGILMKLFDNARDYFRRLRYGPPDNVLEPYGPVLDKFDLRKNPYGK